MFDLPAVQAALRSYHLDGWLLYDFRKLNVLARRVVDLPDNLFLSRRWFYFVPANGEPRKLVHRIERGALDHLPGPKQTYLKWQELEAGVAALTAGSRRLAMEYVPRNANPYVSLVDAGTIELVRSNGVDVVPSGDLVQMFEACWDDEQWQMHLEAAKHTHSAYSVAFQFIRDRVKRDDSVRETEVQKCIMDHFAAHSLITDHPPIVGANEHSSDPHFAPSAENEKAIKQADFVLIDLWAKLNKPRAVYSDLTRTCFVGQTVPEKYTKIFNIVAAARDAGIQRVRTAFANNEELQGWQVDQATRAVIDKAGFGEYFCHRTGHSIGQETHGNGANMDSLETHDTRHVLPRTCFSIEPGIYLPEFGVRSETNVFVDKNKQVHVTGGELQTRVEPLL